MSLITRCQKEFLVHWPRIGTEPTGEPIWGSPVEMTCRWDDKVQEIISPTQTKVISRAQLITQYKLTVGDLVRRGTIAATTFWDDPKQNLDAFEVLSASETPTIRYTERLYEAYV